MPSEATVLFVDRDPPSGFMALEERCLGEESRVVRLTYPGRPTLRFVLDTFRWCWRVDAVYVFFASEHALVPALASAVTNRRFILVPAGYDYANLPERSYGLAARGRAWLPKLIGRLCDVALPISQQTLWEFLALVPSAAPRTFLAYLAVDPTEWESPGVTRDPDRVVTVGYVDAESWSRKGIDRFVEAAAADPDREYVLAGEVKPEIGGFLQSLRIDNLRITGHLPHDELVRLLWSSGIYAQLSWHETFGVALAEAMLCGCAPVITPCAALAETAGRWAEYVPYERDVETDVKTIARVAHKFSDADRMGMRSDVADRFSVRARARLLADAVHGRLQPSRRGLSRRRSN
ncbi:MAG: glycosyltransferase family 4 protein [Acidimicrobiales bacterium]|nr:glycosyltransferase family 4 protein [Acidimicrobiales bacterium]